MSQQDEVTVQVTITERVRYSAYVKMPREKFDALDKQLEETSGREQRKVEERIGDFCDRRSDWQDADDLEVEDFRIVEDQDA